MRQLPTETLAGLFTELILVVKFAEKEKEPKITRTGTCLVFQVRFHLFNAEGAGSIPDQGTKIPHALQHSQKIIKKKKKPGLTLETKRCHIFLNRYNTRSG